MIAQGIIISRMVEAAEAARDQGANLTLEPAGVAVRANGEVRTITYADIEHGVSNVLLEAVQKVTDDH